MRLGGRLDEVARNHGRAYRLGGDEFCVLADVESGRPTWWWPRPPRRCPSTATGFTVRASSGTVRLPGEAATPAAALHLADRRMYADKARDRVVGRAPDARRPGLRRFGSASPSLHEHATDVAALAMAVAAELGMPAEERDEVARAAELHDVGKMAIPDAILAKPGPLDDDEWASCAATP